MYFVLCNSRSACFVEFVQLCLQKQPAVRPTAEDLLQVSSKWNLIKLTPLSRYKFSLPILKLFLLCLLEEFVEILNVFFFMAYVYG